jgi:hypothetical protein
MLPRFDWMQATVTEDPKILADMLGGNLRAEISDGKGLNGYRASYVLKRRDETLARVLYGGANGRPHVIATGAATDDVVPALRLGWQGAHTVTRMDSASDFDEVGGYDRVREVLLELATSSRMQVQEIESTKGGHRSRTIYLGAPASRVRVRLYEKGMFERQKGQHDAPEGWFRLEAQIRPDGLRAREKAAELDAVGAWGQSPMLRKLATAVLGIDVEPVKMQLKREPDYMRALQFLVKQYGPTLERALAEEGSWDAVGRLLDGVAGGQEAARREFAGFGERTAAAARRKAEAE